MSPVVAEFIHQYIQSVWQLELLLYLKGSRKPLCADEIADALYMAVESIANGLSHFEGCGLIQRTTSQSDYYVFCVDDKQLLSAVDETAHVYSLSRVSVVNLIFSSRVHH